MITITKIDGSEITLIPLLDGETAQIRVSNTYLEPKNVKLFVTGKDGTDPAVSTDSNGKEIALENWVSIRQTGGETWYPIGEPASFPDSFDDLAAGYEQEIGVDDYRDFDIKITIPAEFSTSGIAYFSIVAIDGPLAGGSSLSGELTTASVEDPQYAGCYAEFYLLSNLSDGSTTILVSSTFANYLSIFTGDTTFSTVTGPSNSSVGESSDTYTKNTTAGDTYIIVVSTNLAGDIGAFTISASAGTLAKIETPYT